MVTVLSLMLAAAPTVPTHKLVTAPWRTANVEPSLANFYLEALAKALRSEGLSVVTSEDIAAALGLERQRKLLSCSEGTNCLVELGNALGCDGIVVVSLAKLDSTLTATVRIVSSNDGKVLAEGLAESTSQRGFVDALGTAAQKLAGQLRAPPEPGARSPSRALPLTLGISGAALAIGGGVSLYLASSTSGKLDAELQHSHAVTSTAVQLANTGKLEQLLGWIGVGVGGAALVAGIITWIAQTPAEAPAVGLVLTPRGGVLTFGGSF